MKKITMLLGILPFLVGAQITNETFDSDVSGWTTKNSASLSHVDDDGVSALGALKIESPIGVTDSRAQSTPNSAPAEAGDYIFSFQVKGTSGKKIQAGMYQASSGGTESGTTYTLGSSDWEKYSDVFFGKNGVGVDASNLNLRIVAKDESSIYFIDDVKFEKATKENSFIANPDFEAATYDENWALTGDDVSLSTASGKDEVGTGAAITFSADQSGVINLSSAKYDFGKTVDPANTTITFDVKSSSTDIELQAVFKIYDDLVGSTVETLTTGIENPAAINTWETISFNKPITGEFDKVEVKVKIKSGALDGDVVTIDNVTSEFWYVADAVLGVQNNIEQKLEITAYPNPARDVLNFTQEVSFIEVFSILGQKVKQAQDTNSVNVANLNNGSYVVRITNKEGKTTTQRFVKH
jgi:hypothetical protein